MVVGSEARFTKDRVNDLDGSGGPRVLLVGLKEIIHQFEALLFGFEQFEPCGLCENLKLDSLKINYTCSAFVLAVPTNFGTPVFDLSLPDDWIGCGAVIIY